MLISQNPATEEILGEYSELSSIELERKLTLAANVSKTWSTLQFSKKAELFQTFANLLLAKKEIIATTIVDEMGKTYNSALAEIDKCILNCNYYAHNAEIILSPEIIKSTAQESYTVFEPLGIILAIMPWNFPFWQVLRFAVPTLLAGNVVVLKHASNIPQCSQLLEEIFIEAGFELGVFQNLHLSSANIAQVIRDERINAITLTGSEKAGINVAKIAGEELKKAVLELGGNDPYIVLADADIDLAVKTGVTARLQNNGQSCICGKRFIILEEVYEEFLAKYKQAYENYVIGNPLDPKTQMGPLISQQAVEDIDKQVRESINLGATLITGGHKILGKGFFYKPTILADVKKGMPVYDEEVFGPVAAVIKVKTEQEALISANDSKLGLGASIWTKDIAKAKKLARLLNVGMVFINELVKSDPSLPFGGIKKSGYGRELSSYGIKEFVNIKTVYIK